MKDRPNKRLRSLEYDLDDTIAALDRQDALDEAVIPDPEQEGAVAERRDDFQITRTASKLRAARRNQPDFTKK